MTPKYKTCLHCNIKKELNIINFYFRSDSNKFRNKCKECIKNNKPIFKKNYSQNDFKINNINYRKCTKCNEVKILNSNNFNKKGDGRRRDCKICSKLWFKNNKKHISNYKKEYYNKNNKKIKINAKKYRLKNKNKIKEINKKYIKNRMKTDIAFKLNKIFGRNITRALKSKNILRRGKIYNILGYTVNNLKKHLESQFEYWMTWDNWGRYNSRTWDDGDTNTWAWQIDHIVPASKFQYNSIKSSEFKKCWELSNLRPYSAKKNILDGNRR